MKQARECNCEFYPYIYLLKKNTLSTHNVRVVSAGFDRVKYILLLRNGTFTQSNRKEKRKQKVQYPVRVTNEQVVEITSSFSVNIISIRYIVSESPI